MKFFIFWPIVGVLFGFGIARLIQRDMIGVVLVCVASSLLLAGFSWIVSVDLKSIKDLERKK
jgi:hypothetical protein